MPSRKRRRRITITLVGDYVREWEDEEARGGNASQIAMRIMDASRSTSLRNVRHDLYNDLNTIKLAAATQRLKMPTAALREEIAVIESSADSVRAKLGRVSSV